MVFGDRAFGEEIRIKWDYKGGALNPWARSLYERWQERPLSFLSYSGSLLPSLSPSPPPHVHTQRRKTVIYKPGERPYKKLTLWAPWYYTPSFRTLRKLISVVEATQPMIFCYGRWSRLIPSPWTCRPNYGRRTIPFSTYSSKYDLAKITPWSFLVNPDFPTYCLWY